MTGEQERTRVLKGRIKAELVPLLIELGFEKNRKSFAARPIDGPFGNTYSRPRDPYVDEIRINWFGGDYGVMFGLEFWTDQIERMLEPDRTKLVLTELRETYYASIYPYPYPERHGFWARLLEPSPGDFADRMSLRETIDIAKARIVEIDHHLRVGAPTVHMRLVGDVVVKRGDPSNARP
ncbi:MAG: hypothetical protein JWO72_2067 [Caulobacteraceae bacterium]|nr:hypothetical protein [Caulobacteraceae bacterium]